MNLGNRNIVELTRFLESATATQLREKLQQAEFSLAASIWTVLTLDLRSRNENQNLNGYLELPALRHANRYYARGPTFNADKEFRGMSYGFWPIRCANDVASTEWLLFRDRFRIAAKGKKKADRIFHALSGILTEMADNVPSHAFSEQEPFRSMVGYHIWDNSISFSVADMGAGFLHSLIRKPKLSALGTEREALLAVIDQHATSRLGESEGGGFKQLFNTLLDLNGLVYLRSGNCLVEMRNKGDYRQRQIFDKTGGRGSQVTVVISQKSTPIEIPLKIS